MNRSFINRVIILLVFSCYVKVGSAQAQIGVSNAYGFFTDNFDDREASDNLLQLYWSKPAKLDQTRIGANLQWWRNIYRGSRGSRSTSVGASSVDYTVWIISNSFTIQGFVEWSWGNKNAWKFRTQAGVGIEYTFRQINLREGAFGQLHNTNKYIVKYKSFFCAPINVEVGRSFNLAKQHSLELFAGIGSIFRFGSELEIKSETNSPEFVNQSTYPLVEKLKGEQTGIHPLNKPYIGLRYFFEFDKK